MGYTVEFTEEDLEYVQDAGYRFECPECGSQVGLSSPYCHGCGAAFEVSVTVEVETEE